MLRIRGLTSAFFILAAFSGPAFAGADDPWFFSAAEIASAYRYQHQFGARLRDPLDPQACFRGGEEFRALYQGREFTAPCRFVSETVRQLRELLDSGAAKYLFPLDVGGADLAVPAELYTGKYKSLPKEEILPALLRDPALVAVYHSAAHLNPETAARAADGTQNQRRAVAGFFDGRPNRTLALGADGRIDYDSQKLTRVGALNLMAHFLGEISFVAKDGVVTLDLSFESDRGAAHPANVAAVRPPAR